MKFLGKLKGLIKHADRVRTDISRRDDDEHRRVHSFLACRERAISDLSRIRMLEKALADERSRDSGHLSQDPISIESDCLIAAAKSAGCYIPINAIEGTRYSVRTGESEVRMVQKDQLYYKIKNPFAKLHLKKHAVSDVIYEHIIHNILFPDARLDFIGITEDVHEARIVLRQNAIATDKRPCDREIAENLASLGLFAEGRFSFGNDLLFVTDVGQDSDNVLLGKDGKLYFIDPIIGFKLTATEVIDRLIKCSA